MKIYFITMLFFFTNFTFGEFSDKQNKILGACGIAIRNIQFLDQNLRSLRESENKKEIEHEIDQLENLMLGNLRPLLSSTEFLKDTKYADTYISATIAYFEEFCPEKLKLPDDHKKEFEESLKTVTNKELISGYKKIYDSQLKLLIDLKTWKQKHKK